MFEIYCNSLLQGVFEIDHVHGTGMKLVEIADGVQVHDIVNSTGCEFQVSSEIPSHQPLIARWLTLCITRPLTYSLYHAPADLLFVSCARWLTLHITRPLTYSLYRPLTYSSYHVPADLLFVSRTRWLTLRIARWLTLHITRPLITLRITRPLMYMPARVHPILL